MVPSSSLDSLPLLKGVGLGDVVCLSDSALLTVRGLFFVLFVCFFFHYVLGFLFVCFCLFVVFFLFFFVCYAYRLFTIWPHAGVYIFGLVGKEDSL